MPGKFGTVLEIVDMALDAGMFVTVIPRLVNAFRGNQVDESKIQQLVAEGKIKEASQQVMSSWTTGLSGKDENRLLAHVCKAIAEDSFTVDQGLAFFNYLDQAGPQKRKKFRDVFVAETDEEKTMTIVIILAKLSDDTKRSTFLNGAGVNDPSTWEHILETLELPLERFGDAARERLVDLERRHAERILAKPKKKQPKRKPGGLASSIAASFGIRFLG